MSTINCRGKLVDLSCPKVMGILNLTPDSFYDGGRSSDVKVMLEHVEKMVSEGADFIDIGGYSSRPGAEHVPADEELQRVLPAVKAIISQFPSTIISVDTFRSNVAARCIEEGASIINDISAGALDNQMMQTIANYQVPYIMMHMRGNVQNTHQQIAYDDIMKEILTYFSQKIANARSYGINDLIIDPGFGFSKTLEHNYEVLEDLDHFAITDLPLLVGFSRKSMVCKVLEVNPENALNGTTVLNTLALSKGAKILRVHDVKEAKQCVDLFLKMNRQPIH
jgi:dihydropteroate synthase